MYVYKRAGMFCCDVGNGVPFCLWATRILSNAGLGFEDKMIDFAIIKSFPPSLLTLKTIILSGSPGTEPSELPSQYVIISELVQ